VNETVKRDRRPADEEKQSGGHMPIETRAALRAAVAPFERPSVVKKEKLNKMKNEEKKVENKR